MFFVQVRPSPWRQAVDLGNMMLVLAVRTDPDRVYQRALRYFTPDELAEAFAATRGVASPTQLRAFMKRDPRDLLGAFRALAPPREPIALQRWSIRRVGLACTMLVASSSQSSSAARPSARPGTWGVHSAVRDRPPMILAAQAVPSRRCCPASPRSRRVAGGGRRHRHRASRFWLNSDKAGARAVTISLSASCDAAGTRPVPSDQPGTRRFERPFSHSPQFADLRLYTFPGGCVTYQFKFAPGTSPLLAIPCQRRGGLCPPGQAGRKHQAHRGPGLVRAGCGMSGVSRKVRLPATTGARACRHHRGGTSLSPPWWWR